MNLLLKVQNANVGDVMGNMYKARDVDSFTLLLIFLLGAALFVLLILLVFWIKSKTRPGYSSLPTDEDSQKVKIKILDLLESGKISAGESVELLKAVKGKSVDVIDNKVVENIQGR